MCVFCMIANGEIPTNKVYEDKDVMAFLDLSQATLGHTLVIPKKHFDNIYALDSDTASKVFVVTKSGFDLHCIADVPVIDNKQKFTAVLEI